MLAYFYLGTLELTEMLEMFTQFGFESKEEDLRHLFAISNSQQPGKMTLEEFKKFM